MVEALLKKTKTETRRDRGLKKVNESPNDWVYNWIDVHEDGLYARFESTKGLPHKSIKCPYGFVEDQLWVRETFRLTDFLSVEDDEYGYIYKASENGRLWENLHESWKWQPSLFMPRAASRFDLEIVNITCERLQDITEEGAIAEGVESATSPKGSFREGTDYRDYSCKFTTYKFFSPINSYQTLFELINGKGSWELNPWVWVVKFKNVTKK
jgi:hypothetical protein